MLRLASIALLLCFATATHAQQRPLITEDVDIIPPGSIRIEAGIDFMQGAKYPVSGIRGDLTRVGVISVNFGMSPNVEFQIEGVAQNYLSINSRGPSAVPLSIAPGANSTNDTGDFDLSASLELRDLIEAPFCQLCADQLELGPATFAQRLEIGLHAEARERLFIGLGRDGF